MNLSVFVIEFSDDLYSLILNGLKDEDADYVDIFDPTIKGYVPAYNFVHLGKDVDIDRKAERLTSHLRSLYTLDEFSSGIEQIQRNAFPLVLADPDATLLDMRKILEDTPEAKTKREKILKKHLSDNRELGLFWERDYSSIDKRKKKLALTKLTKFLTDKRVQHMFGVKQNKFSAADTMKQGRVFLANLDEGIIGRGASNFIAGCLGEDIYDATQARTVLSPNERELMPCRIYWDEFFRAPMKSFEQATVSFRRYNVSLILSYHFQEQLSKTLQAGIKNLGTAIALKQGYDEARRASNTFLAKVTANQFMSLDQGEGYIKKPNSQIRRFKSEKQEAEGNKDVIARLKERNIRDNYVKISDIEKEIKKQEQEKETEWAGEDAI